MATTALQRLITGIVEGRKLFETVTVGARGHHIRKPQPAFHMEVSALDLAVDLPVDLVLQ